MDEAWQEELELMPGSKNPGRSITSGEIEEIKARDSGNYANISPLMDILFGTYRCPDHEPEAFGINEPIPRSYLGQMVHPFRPRRGRGKTH